MGSKASSLRNSAKSTPKAQSKPKKHSSFPIHPTYEDKTKLVYVRMHSSIYRRLSVNIVREICELLSDSQVILVNSGPQVYKFKPATKEFTPFFEVACMLGNGSLLASTFMGPEKAFMVLMNCTSMFEDPPYFATYVSEHITDYGYQYDRSGCAVVYDQGRDCVYIFGGDQPLRMGLTDQPHKRSERFRVSNSEFEQLPDMLRARSCLGCCWHIGLVFLCGGGHSSIETFDPNAEKFTERSVLLEHKPENDRCFSAVSIGTELIVVSRTWMWRGTHTHLAKKQRCLDDRQQSNIGGKAVLWGNNLYVSSYAGYAEIELTDGRETYCQIKSGI